MPRKTPEDNRSYIFGILPVLENHIQAQGDKITRDITYKQWTVLLIVRDMPEGSSVSQLAAQHGSSRQNVKRMLDTLQAGGYVSLRQDPKDARGYAVYLTGKARTLMAEISTVGRRYVQDIFTGINGKDIDTTKRVLTQLLENVQTTNPDEYTR